MSCFYVSCGSENSFYSQIENSRTPWRLVGLRCCARHTSESKRWTFLDLSSCPVYDRLWVVRCQRCTGLGHKPDHCSANNHVWCGHCLGAHTSNGCPNRSSSSSANYKRVGCSRNHSSFSSQYPPYLPGRHLCAFELKCRQTIPIIILFFLLIQKLCLVRNDWQIVLATLLNLILRACSSRVALFLLVWSIYVQLTMKHLSSLICSFPAPLSNLLFLCLTATWILYSDISSFLGHLPYTHSC